MSEFHHHEEQCNFGFEPLESIVQAAGSYVHPTDDLRPKTLEAARSAKRQRQRNFQIGAIVVGIVFMALTGLPGNLLNWGPPKAVTTLQAVRHYDLHKQASLRILQAGLDPSWAFYEAFIQLRSHQAELFDESLE